MTTRALWLLDDGLILGGGQLFALRLAQWAGRPVRILCPAGSPLWQHAHAVGVPCVDVAFPEPAPAQALALAGAVVRLRAALRGATAADDVVVSGSARCSALAAPALAGRRDAPPLVHLLHECDSAARASVRLALRRSRRVVAVGAVAAAAYRNALPAARIVQTNNFLAPDVLDGLVARRGHHREAPPRLGVAARLIPEKGVAELVGELAAAPSAWRDLQVAGALQDVAETARVRAAITAAGLEDRVRLLGAIDEMDAFLASRDVLVVPSVGNEGQPTVMLEGLAAGLTVIARAPMVSTDFDGLPVHPYHGVDDLGAVLAAADSYPPAAREELAQRFGPAQAVRAIDEAAG